MNFLIHLFNLKHFKGLLDSSLMFCLEQYVLPVPSEIKRRSTIVRILSCVKYFYFYWNVKYEKPLILNTMIHKVLLWQAQQFRWIISWIHLYLLLKLLKCIKEGTQKNFGSVFICFKISFIYSRHFSLKNNFFQMKHYFIFLVTYFSIGWFFLTT